MPRKYKIDLSSGYTLLLVDDNAEYLEATTLLLEREGHRVLRAASGPEALSLLHQQQIDLMLLDYFMPGMSGEEVVEQLRLFNPYIQVILQTGYASERPPREMLRRLDIQGYYDKSEGPDKLLLWTDAALKSAYTIQLLFKSREGLRYILDVTPELHKVQPLEDLLQGILWQLAGLLGAVNSFLAVIPEESLLHSEPVETDGFLAMIEENANLVIRASTGHFVSQTIIDSQLDPDELKSILAILQIGEIKIAKTSTVVPLRVGESSIGVIYLDRPAIFEQDKELLNIFANQAAVAIQNVQLYEMATLDPLTGVYVRRIFEQWIQRELRTAFRSQQPLALLMMDIDKMKHINDTAGHLAGDQALIVVGKVLREATRSSDIVARYGGEEFAIVLPKTQAEGAERVAQRIQEFLSEKSVTGPDGPIPLRVSIGLSVLEPHTFSPSEIPHPIATTYFQTMAQTLIHRADETLYEVKRRGGNCVQQGAPTQWERPTS